MNVKIYAMVPAMVLAFGAATALAQPRMSPIAQYDQASLVMHSAQFRPYDQGGAAAYVGSGSDPLYQAHRNELLTEPGYSIGTGAAQVGDGATPGYQAEQRQLWREPGFHFGEGTAMITDGSSPNYLRSQQELRNEPGYSIGTGAARVRGAS